MKKGDLRNQMRIFAQANGVYIFLVMKAQKASSKSYQKTMGTFINLTHMRLIYVACSSCTHYIVYGKGVTHSDFGRFFLLKI